MAPGGQNGRCPTVQQWIRRWMNTSGGKEIILSLTLPDLSVDTCTLQELVNLWHDELGMCNVFTTASLLLEANSCT